MNRHRDLNHWVKKSISKIEADLQRSSDTHLYQVPLPAVANIDLYLKDESTHPTGSLKHRLARSLFLYGLCNGNIGKGTTIIEASSGSTAISEAYFAWLLGLPFIAVIPKGTSQEKIDQISFYQGQCHLVEAEQIYLEAEKLAVEKHGYYMDQFTYAERATDWRGNNNIAESIFHQMKLEHFPIPKWIVMSAGTGGTSATIGRFIRYQGYETQLCVADPTHSVFFDYYRTKDKSLVCQKQSKIEGIGRPRVEPSFIDSVIDRMIKVPDEAALATIHFLTGIFNRRLGGSTGSNLYATFQIISELAEEGFSGSLVSLICDSGERYQNTYYDRDWLRKNCFQDGMEKYSKKLEKFYQTGRLESSLPSVARVQDQVKVDERSLDPRE